MLAKRCFDLLFTIPGLIFLSPLFIVIAVWIKLDSTGEVFFRQKRVGLHGRIFEILKFRTMIAEAPKQGLQITVGQDNRITRCGYILRKYKLDELPQLINVLIGDMSLVGPRPEVPRYIAEYTKRERDIVLSVRPGITDNASIAYRDESSVLAQASSPEETYIQEILPIKISYYIDYVHNRSLWNDFIIIWRTFAAILKR